MASSAPAPRPVCPHCRGELSADACAGCGRRFERRAGFLDLRTAHSAEIDAGADAELAEQIARVPGGFDEALERYFAARPAVSEEAGRRHREHFRAETLRARRAVASLGAGGALLDVGCGLGRYTAEAARAGMAAVGIDVSLAALAVARKLLEHERLEATLLAASAGSLPFPDESFGAAVAADLLEHLPEPGRAVAEVSRVLAPGGGWIASTPNRFSLTPEPHVGLWGLGWMPRDWAVARVRRRFGIDYSPIRLLSFSRLERLLAESFDGPCEIRAARLTAEELEALPLIRRWLGRGYQVATALPGFRLFAPYWTIRGTARG